MPIDTGGYFDHTPHSIAHDFRRTAITMLESMGISVEYSHHEGAPGQQEIDLRYADALTTADNIMSFRLVMKEVAIEQGVYATFMPKPFTDHPGSGMHTHVSLFEGDKNAFYEAGAEFQLSKTARAFIAGLLQHAPEITAVCNQWVNSYKRLWGAAERTAGAGGEAPAYVCWGHNNRSALVRVPMYKPQKGNSTRVEFRSLDAACNPYLAFAVILAAGLKGIEEDYELPPGAEDDVWALTSAERRALGIRPLPQDLDQAIRSCRTASSSPRRWGSTSSTSSCATSARSGRSTAARSPSTSWAATSPCSVGPTANDDRADVGGRGDGVTGRGALRGADGGLTHSCVGDDLVGRGAGHVYGDRADVGRGLYRGRCGGKARADAAHAGGQADRGTGEAGGVDEPDIRLDGDAPGQPGEPDRAGAGRDPDRLATRHGLACRPRRRRVASGRSYVTVSVAAADGARRGPGGVLE